MKIEADKYYWNSDGEIRGPLIVWDDNVRVCVVTGEEFTPEGVALNPDDSSLVEEAHFQPRKPC